MKIFVSTPMRGISDDVVLENQNKAIAWYCSHYITDGEIELVNNIKHPNIPADAPAQYHLAESIRQMVDADVVIFAEGWEHARGCLVEMTICKLYNIKTYETPNLV